MVKKAVLIIFLLVLFSPLIYGQSVPITLRECKQSGWLEGRVYVLANDLGAADINNVQGHCMQIDADSVTLECESNSIVGSGTAGSAGVYVPAHNSVTVRHCIISNFDSGIEYANANGGTVLENMLFDNLQNGVIISSSTGVVVDNNLVFDNDGAGVRLFSSSDTVFSDNAFCSNNEVPASRDFEFWCTTRCAGTSGTGNQITRIVGSDNSNQDNWPVLGTDYETCNPGFCGRDSHCGAGEYCDVATNLCVANAQCTSNLNCVMGEFCNLNTRMCVECMTDGDCSAGERCSLNTNTCQIVTTTGLGTLSVSSTPAGASIYVDGDLFGTTINTPMEFKLDPGTYTVTLSLTGYGDYSETVGILSDQTTSVNTALVSSSIITVPGTDITFDSNTCTPSFFWYNLGTPSAGGTNGVYADLGSVVRAYATCLRGISDGTSVVFAIWEYDGASFLDDFVGSGTGNVQSMVAYVDVRASFIGDGIFDNENEYRFEVHPEDLKNPSIGGSGTTNRDLLFVREPTSCPASGPCEFELSSCKQSGWVSGGTYRLINDLGVEDLDVNGNCMIIPVSDVTLDCNGHSINGLGGVTLTNRLTVGVTARGIQRVSVKNCEITNFGQGISFVLVSGGSVADNTFLNSTYGVYILNTNSVIFSSNRAYDNDRGMDIRLNSKNNIINGNLFCKNRVINGWDLAFVCTAAYPCPGNSGRGNTFTNVRTEDGSDADNWPVLDVDYKDCGNFCIRDGHCAKGNVCDEGTNTCIASCSSDVECGSGDVCNLKTSKCEKAVTTTTGTCSGDNDCAVGEICNVDTKMCEAVVAVACGSDTDCNTGEVCNTVTNVCEVAVGGGQDGTGETPAGEGGDSGGAGPGDTGGTTPNYCFGQICGESASCEPSGFSTEWGSCCEGICTESYTNPLTGTPFEYAYLCEDLDGDGIGEQTRLVCENSPCGRNNLVGNELLIDVGVTSAEEVVGYCNVEPDEERFMGGTDAPAYGLTSLFITLGLLAGYYLFRKKY